MSASPIRATASTSNPWNARRNASRFARIVRHDSPAWNPSSASFSNSRRSSTTGKPHSRS